MLAFPVGSLVGLGTLDDVGHIAVNQHHGRLCSCCRTRVVRIHGFLRHEGQDVLGGGGHDALVVVLWPGAVNGFVAQQMDIVEGGLVRIHIENSGKIDLLVAAAQLGQAH